MARRIRWQILIATISSIVVFALTGYLALTTAAVARPVAGGSYVEGLLAPPRQLNPLISDPVRDPAGADIQALLFDGLMRIGTDGLPEPGLARTWPEIDDTGTVYTFTLRTDVTWHDGRPLTVDDVLFTLREVQGRAFVGDPVTGGVWRNVLIDRVGENQIRCTLSAPFAPFLSLATFPILPAHLLADVPPEEWATSAFAQRPIGTGPYALEAIDSEHALLRANPGYYRGRPYLDTIELRFFDAPQEAVSALSRGELTAFGYVSTSGVGPVEAPDSAVSYETPLDSYTVLTFNLREPIVGDLELRRALATGLNKEALIADALDGRAVRLDTPILSGSWAAAPDLIWYPFDLELAGAMLDDLGYERGPDGVRVRNGAPLLLPLITDDAPDRVASAEFIAAQWAELGVEVPVEVLAPDVLQQRLADHDFVLALHGWQRLGPDPDVLELWHSSRAESGSNYAGLDDEQVDALLSEARQNNDVLDRLNAYTAFQRRWIELAPSIVLYQPLFIYVTNGQLGGYLPASPGTPPDDVAGDDLLLGREDRYRNVLRWFLQSEREIGGALR